MTARSEKPWVKTARSISVLDDVQRRRQPVNLAEPPFPQMDIFVRRTIEHCRVHGHKKAVGVRCRWTILLKNHAPGAEILSRQVQPLWIVFQEFPDLVGRDRARSLGAESDSHSNTLS